LYEVWLEGIMQALAAAGTLTPMRVWEGVTVRVFNGEHVTMAIAELAPNTVVPRHQHVSEQVGTVVEGSARFITEGETLELRAGGTYRFRSELPHQVEVGPEGAVLVECFHPRREDWATLTPIADPTVRWPAPG
jgi:quercetin dioxygenase-like cupin family protein